MLVITIHETAQTNGEQCAYFDRAWWWKPLDLLNDARFRKLDPAYAVGCLTTEEMRELQNLFRAPDGHTHKRESDRLDEHLSEDGGRWWVVCVCEFEAAIDEVAMGDLE